jgi:hypothetical protein
MKRLKLVLMVVAVMVMLLMSTAAPAMVKGNGNHPDRNQDLGGISPLARTLFSLRRCALFHCTLLIVYRALVAQS